jgi:hypothetical protein
MNKPSPSSQRAAAPEVTHAAKPRPSEPSRGSLRVVSEDGRGTRPASVVMPLANTDLTAMFARDRTLCVKPRPKPVVEQQPGATTLAAAQPQPPVDAELARLTEIWPSLSSNARAAIVAMAYEAAADEK